MQVELKRMIHAAWAVDIGWRDGDLLFHFYSNPKDVVDLDERLDPIFTKIFNMPIVNKNELLAKIDEQIHKQFPTNEVRTDFYEKTNIIAKLKAVEDVPGIHKAWTCIESDSINYRGVAVIQSWSYTLKNVDRMFLDQKVKKLLESLEASLGS